VSRRRFVRKPRTYFFDAADSEDLARIDGSHE
jgi:hypothetical protein